jgi:DNA polymerase III alpha subunit
VPVPREYSAQQRWAHEWELFGFPLSQHPLDLLKDVVGRTRYISACELGQHVGRTITLLGWLVTEKIVSSKKGEPMEFATFEDQRSLYDATFFPSTYRQYCHLLVPNQAYLLTGLVEEHFATVTLTVTGLEPLSSRAPAETDIPLEQDAAGPVH